MVDVTTITTGTVGGTGYFDKFMDAINEQLKSQLSLGRIQTTDYATVYLGAMQTALAQAVAYTQVVEQVAASQSRTAAEVALLNQKKLTEEAQIKAVLSDGTTVFDTDNKLGYGAVGKQQQVQQAQSDGFLRDAEQKALKIILDAWSVAKSVDQEQLPLPDGARGDDIEAMIIQLRQGIGITSSIYSALIADAGLDKNIVANEDSVILDASSSRPPEGATISTYLWEKVSGSALGGTGLIANNTQKIASFTAPALDVSNPENNILKFKLTVTDTSDPSNTEIDYVTYTVV